MSDITSSTVTNITAKPMFRRANQAWLPALCALGFLLTSQSALAGGWWAGTIDGQSTVNGQVLGPVFPWSSVLIGNTFYIYATDTDGTIYEGWLANGSWHYIPIYSSISAPALTVSASLVNNLLYVAHVDSDHKLRLSSWLFNWSTRTVDGEGESTFNNIGGEIATVASGDKFYIFYHEWNPSWNGKNVLRCATFDGSQFTYQLLDGDSSVGPGRVTANLNEPAAIAAPDGLHIYYYDEDRHVLREAFSSNGSNWTGFDDLDGTGANGGIMGNVGHHPSAIVDLYNSTVNVFYEDRTNTNTRLRTAQRPMTLWSKWNFAWIDETLDTGSFSAPVIHGKAMQVYYTANNGQLRAAWGTGPHAFNVAVLDGPGGVALGASPDMMLSPVTAVEFNGAPTVFYQDAVNGALRNSHWVP